MQRTSRILLFGGTVVAVVGLSKVHAAWVAEDVYDWSTSSRFAWSLTYAGLLCVAAYGVGLPDLVRGSRSALSWSTAAPAVAAIVISVVQLITGDALLPRFVVFGCVLLLVPWYMLCAAVAMGGRVRAQRRDRVVVVGASDEVVALVDELDQDPERHAQVITHLAPVEARSSGPRHRPLVEAATAGAATVVVLDIAAQADESIVAQAASLHEAGMRVRSLSLFYEEWLGKLPIAELERVSLMFDIGEVHRARYGRVKRLADLVMAAVGCIALLAVTPLVAVGNSFGNRGPLFYRQPRVGRFGREFRILKFRTMRPGGASAETFWTGEDDPRITPFGRLLRKIHLDELPQMVNVLRGDLSVVGPRPEQPRYVAELKEKIPFYNLRHLVRPGLTGWAQVKYRYAGTEADALEKLQYEFFYLRHQGLRLDARVIGRTVRSVIGRGGR